MNILFLADPSSIHDIKWMRFFENEHQLHLLRRAIHLPAPDELKGVIHDHGTIPDFSLIRPWLLVKGAWRIRKVIKREKIDLIHVYYAEPNVLWFLFRKFFRVKTLLTTRGSDLLVTIPAHFSTFSIQNFYVRFLYRGALAHCDLVTCTSRSQVDSLGNFFNLRQKPMIVRTGIDLLDTTKYQKSDLPIELNNRPFILMPRAMKPIYFHEFTIQAIEHLPESVKQEYAFVFLDRNSKDEEYVKMIHERMNATDESIFVFLTKQPQDQLYTLYKYASLIVMNPKTDGSPVSGLEAMLFSKPLIVGPAGYDPDLFGDWILKLTSWTPSDLTNLILQALEDYSEENLKRARQKVMELGNRRLEMAKIRDVYNRLVTT